MENPYGHAPFRSRSTGPLPEHGFTALGVPIGHCDYVREWGQRRRREEQAHRPLRAQARASSPQGLTVFGIHAHVGSAKSDLHDLRRQRGGPVRGYGREPGGLWTRLGQCLVSRLQSGRWHSIVKK